MGEGLLLAKWGAPAVMFAGWMVWPAIPKGDDGAAPADASKFKFEQGEIGELPRLA